MPKATILTSPKLLNVQSGDFVATSLPGAFMPFAMANPRAKCLKTAWETQKALFEQQMDRSPCVGERRLGLIMGRLRYEDFRRRYFAAQRLDDFAPLSGVLPEVGHIAILEVTAEGEIWIIEARPAGSTGSQDIFATSKNGVTRTPYKLWLEQCDGYRVWLARLKGHSALDRARIAHQARSYIGRDYAFFNLKLDDESSFYCSKLVWLSVWKALGVAVDGSAELNRNFWVSPKMMMNSPCVFMLSGRGIYGIS